MPISDPNAITADEPSLQSAAASARFLTLFQHLKSAQLVEDQDRRVALVNQAFCDMFGIPASPEQLMGTDCAPRLATTARTATTG